MAKIPSKFLPPEEYLPEVVRLLPELSYPEKFNLADILLDQNVRDRADRWPSIMGIIESAIKISNP